MKENTVKVRMLPVCDCGYVFREGVVIYKHIHESNGYKYMTPSIVPRKCPNCKRIIECVEQQIVKE